MRPVAGRLSTSATAAATQEVSMNARKTVIVTGAGTGIMQGHRATLCAGRV